MFTTLWRHSYRLSVHAAKQHPRRHYRRRFGEALATAARSASLIGLVGTLALTGCSSKTATVAAQASPTTAPQVAPLIASPIATPARPASPGTLSGEIIGVHDGDSFRLRLTTGQVVRVRLGAIDAPELGQPYADRARDTLANWLAQPTIRMNAYKTDPFGRYVATVRMGDDDVGLAMVRAGLAWHFTRYAREQTPAQRQRYEQAQREAQQSHRGLWADRQPLAPWEHRRKARSGQARSPQRP